MTAAQHSSGKQDFTWLINDFVHKVHGVSHALIMSADGFPLTSSDSMNNDDAEQLAAIASGLLSLAGNSAALFHKGSCEQIIIRLTHGYFLFMGIGVGAGLAVLTGPECDMKVVAYEMTQFVRNAGHVLTPEIRADLRRVLTARRPQA
ncbi:MULTISPECIES: roadblock/LC7 domain-containing protein [Amycolatopsis]|uniref:Regulator of Ras-like GTPase activity (Roadblock/LC7/MglB family) n=1 Tax=Amycolatopsis magusensis TaxID=882444 RepID=A0ABS4Q5G6_9PSEU|nr:MULTISPECIES: roadblock/LC7 domain-containing protein [Amycolatopsis]MBN6033925.1 roadblock/LC7 domain-containing protein [Amycolatopsis sp. 195334CR]MBP2186934.1 putative regulator of Ras-like GTPase activity (Roadblock/LC7/MglB family) [Amycolatopsis magusensis]UJW35547.1 roadblock/LC7 domain-containing protein [Saccharothrix sp. AJ9571]